MSTALALYLLATADAAFCGYRAAAGRNALIDKRRYYRRAMLQGGLWGQLAVGLAAAPLLLFVVLDADSMQAWNTLIEAGRRMLVVYVPYAAIVLLGFLARALPSVDARSLTSTLVFGPLTLLRPAVAVAGVLYACVPANRAALTLAGVLVLALMLSLEPFLSLRHRSVSKPERFRAS